MRCRFQGTMLPFLTLFALPGALFSLVGCTVVTNPQAGPAPITTSVRISKVRSISENPDYQAAVKLFAAGDKAAALKALEAIRKTPKLSVTDQAFLDKQIAICNNKPIDSLTQTTARSAPKAIGAGDCGPRALLIAAKEFGINADLSALTKAASTTTDGTNLEGLTKAAKSIGIKAEGIQADKDALARIPVPAIAWWQGNHFVAVLKISESLLDGKQTAQIHDPNKPEPETIPLETLLAQSGGILLTLEKSLAKQ
jgi:hypothetical protein